MAGKGGQVLQPFKFMLMMLQVIAFTVIINVKNQHIMGKAVPLRLGLESELYISSNRYLMTWCVIALICLFLEFIIIFSGVTLFNDKFNIMVIGSHILGLFVTLLFIRNADVDEEVSSNLVGGHYENVRGVAIFAAAFPLALEGMNYISSYLNYRTRIIL